jgi:hypothetical protein
MGIARISLLGSNEITEVHFFRNENKTGAHPFITTPAEIDTKDQSANMLYTIFYHVVASTPAVKKIIFWFCMYFKI